MKKGAYAEGVNEVVPVDIRKIRQVLDLTMQQMGRKISAYSQLTKPVPGTRVNEWEMGVRPTPAHVFKACAGMLLDEWSEDRHMAVVQRQGEVDVFYGSVLNEPLGELFRLEMGLSKSRNLRARKAVSAVRKTRIAQMRYLEELLSVKMAYVFASEAQMGCCDLHEVQ